MTIPDYQTVMLALLRSAADGQVHSLRDAVEYLAEHFDLSGEERQQLLLGLRRRLHRTCRDARSPLVTRDASLAPALEIRAKVEVYG